MKENKKVSENVSIIIDLIIKNKNEIIYFEKIDIENIKIENLANKIGKKYIQFYEDNYDKYIRTDNLLDDNIVELDIRSFKIDDKEIDLETMIYLDMIIESNVGVKALNGKYNCTVNGIYLKNLAKVIVEIIENSAYDDNTDMDRIKVYIKNFKIEEK